MNSNDNTGAQASPASQKRLVAATVIRGLAFVLANARTYGLAHNITVHAIDMVADALANYFRSYGTLTFEIKEADFLHEGIAVDMRTPATEMLARRLAELGAADISFSPETSRSELDRWFTLLDSAPAGLPGSFGETLGAAGFLGIRSGAVRFREVAEDEAVVKKAEIGPAARDSFAENLRNATRLLETVPDGQPMPALPIELSDNQAFDDLLRISRLPALMQESMPANQMADESASRLERLAEGLMAHPANRTQAGRQSLRKLLRKAEAEITERLQKLGADILAVERLATRVKRLVEDLAVDGIAARYVKLSAQAEADRARLRRRLRSALRHGAASGMALQDRLIEAGLTEEMVDDLLASDKDAAKSADSARPEAESTFSPPAVSPLSELLSRLKETKPGSGELPNLVDGILGEMSRSLLDTQRNAGKQLDTLRKIVSIPSGGQTGNSRLTRQQLQTLMAELGQQLRQPLTVVSGGVGMILSGYFGKVPETQMPIAKLVSDSVAELDSLILRLIDIAGIPESFDPGPFATQAPASETPPKPL